VNKLETVSITKVQDVDKAVRESIDLLGGLGVSPGKRVVVKPNICNAKNPKGMVITDFRVIKAVIDLLHENGNEVVVVESDNIAGTADERVEGSGLKPLLNDWGVEFLNLSHDDYEEYPVANTVIRLPRTVLDAEYFINLPKVKTCAYTLVTLGIKNLYGIFQRKKKNKLHKHLDTVLPFLAETIRNDLVVVDGINCMEGNGPIIGNHVPLNLIIAGRNVVSVDAVCSRLMGYEPSKIPHIAASSSRGVGPIDLDSINIVGEDWRQHTHRFAPPYSLKATLKSLKTLREIYLE